MSVVSSPSPVDQFKSLVKNVLSLPHVSLNEQGAQELVAVMYEQPDWASLVNHYDAVGNAADSKQVLPSHLMKGTIPPDHISPSRIMMNQIGRIFSHIQRFGTEVGQIIPAVPLLYGYQSIEEAVATYPASMGGQYPISHKEHIQYEAQFGAPPLSKLLMGRNFSSAVLISGQPDSGRSSLWFNTLISDPQDDRAIFIFTDQVEQHRAGLTNGFCDSIRLADFVETGFYSFNNAYPVHLVDTELQNKDDKLEIAVQITRETAKHSPNSLFIFDDSHIAYLAEREKYSLILEQAIKDLTTLGVHVVFVGGPLSTISHRLFTACEYHLLTQGSLDDYDWEGNPFGLAPKLIHDVIAFAATDPDDSCTYFVHSAQHPEGRLARISTMKSEDGDRFVPATMCSA